MNDFNLQVEEKEKKKKEELERTKKEEEELVSFIALVIEVTEDVFYSN